MLLPSVVVFSAKVNEEPVVVLVFHKTNRNIKLRLINYIFLTFLWSSVSSVPGEAYFKSVWRHLWLSWTAAWWSGVTPLLSWASHTPLETGTWDIPRVSTAWSMVLMHPRWPSKIKQNINMDWMFLAWTTGEWIGGGRPMMGKVSGLRRLNPENIIDVRQIFTWKLYYEFYI